MTTGCIDQVIRLLVATSLIITMSSCASLDPSDDISRAASMTEARAGTAASWDLPWNVESFSWDGTSDLTSDVAIRCALQNNRDIRAQVESISATRAEFVQEHLLPNPVLNLAFGFPIDSMMSGSMINSMLMQQLSWLWTREPRIDGARAMLEKQVFALSDSALTLVAEVRTAHAHVAIFEASVELENRGLDLLRESVALTESLFAAGEASQLDLNRLRLEASLTEVKLADRELALAMAKRDLMAIIGRAGSDLAWRTGGVEFDTQLLPAQLDEALATDLAIQQRLDVVAARLSIVQSEANVELAGRGRLPDFAAGGMFEQEMSGNTMAGPAVQVTLPIFDDNRAVIARAESELEQARIRADGTIERAISEVRRAWVAFHAAADALNVYEREVLRLAEENVALARLTFEAGESDFMALLDAQRQLVSVDIEHTSRKFAVAEWYFELERAAGGTLVPADTTSEPGT